MAADVTPANRPVIVHQPPRLTPVQRRAVLALLEHPTLAQAADAVGTSARTLNRWLRLPHFRACFERLCEAREAALAARFQQGTQQALDILCDIAANKHKDAGHRVQACRHLLEYADRRQTRRKI